MTIWFKVEMEHVDAENAMDCRKRNEKECYKSQMEINLNAFKVVFKARSEAVQVILDAGCQVCVNLKKMKKKLQFYML